MEVFVLVFIECYEDHDVIGVYGSLERARAEVERINAKRKVNKLQESAVPAVGSIIGPQVIARWRAREGDGAYIERHTLVA